MNGNAETAVHDWAVTFAAIGTSLVAFFLYLYTLAPGLTWAHFGADGGELIAAAMVNGVPHPPGYPLYMMLLRLWLMVGQTIFPDVELAWLGNLFSACCASASVGVTVVVGAHLLRRTSLASRERPQLGVLFLGSRHDWMWAANIGLAWATAPLLWKQAIITEVYALHVLLIALLGWALINYQGRIGLIALPIALGLAHHLTFVLLLPGILYWLWQVEQVSADASNVRMGLKNLVKAGCKLLPALFLGLLIYIRIPLVAANGPPINWGYPDNWEGFWWLTSASAYRNYLFGVPASSIFDRIAEWAYNLTSQFSAIGLGLALLGLSKWDREAPQLRNWGLLWILIVSIYAISYYTKDSTIYLLPCIWLLAIWLGVGLVACWEWILAIALVESDSRRNQASEAMRVPSTLAGWALKARNLPDYVPPLFAISLIIILALVRLPEVSLRDDVSASTFLDETERLLRDENVLAESIIISSADNETFSLWYGVWGNRQLVNRYASDAEGEMSPSNRNEPFLINGALLQFPWYQRQVKEQYPNLPGAGNTVPILIRKNQHLRPIFFSEEDQLFVNRDLLEPAGPLWRYQVTGN